MKYIEKIKNNVTNIINIKKLSIEKNVDYKVAKVMYYTGNTNIDKKTANEIIMKVEVLNIPLYILKDLDIIGIYKEENRFKMPEILNKLAEYANNKTVNEISKYLNIKNSYALELLNLTRNGMSIEKAIQTFDEKVKKEMETKKMSEIAATANILYFKNDIASVAFDEAQKHQKAPKQKPIEAIKQGLLLMNQVKKKTVHGIQLFSLTDKRLEELEKIINTAFQKGNPKFIKKLTEEINKNGLYVTDFPIYQSEKKKPQPSYYSEKHIYLAEYSSLEGSVAGFYHEASHFLDNVSEHKIDKNYYTYSTKNPKVRRALFRIESEINIYRRGLSIRYLTEYNAKKYINDPVLNEKWLKEIKEEGLYDTEEEIKQFMIQKRNEEKKKYKLLIIAITDIYDALSSGKLGQLKVWGHGKEYYADSSNKTAEFIAQIGRLYNADGIDLMYHELGKNLTEKIIEVYNDLISDENEQTQTQHTR